MKMNEFLGIYCVNTAAPWENELCTTLQDLKYYFCNIPAYQMIDLLYNLLENGSHTYTGINGDIYNFKAVYKT